MTLGTYSTTYHAPALCAAAVTALVTDRAGVYVDATVGGGGHSRALLDCLDKEGSVIGLDRDESAIREASARLAEEQDCGRFTPMNGSFDGLERCLNATGVSQVDGILADLGVSSHQLDTGERGFSHRISGPLDMRMDTRELRTAAEIVNDWEVRRIEELLRSAGEEPAAGRISRAIVASRPLESTHALAAVVKSMVPSRRARKSLARVFQALRIAVNRELEELEALLWSATRLVRSGGHMAVICYHSLEDRRVKRMFRYGNLEGVPVRDFYGKLQVPWRELMRRPVRPSLEESEANPRARSARLRAAERLSGPSAIEAQ